MLRQPTTAARRMQRSNKDVDEDRRSTVKKAVESQRGSVPNGKRKTVATPTVVAGNPAEGRARLNAVYREERELNS